MGFFFPRIYSRGRQKIAKAVVLGKQIIIEGGKVYFDSEWFSCKECGCFFNNPDRQEEITECPLCRSKDFSGYEQKDDEPEVYMPHSNSVCICPECGYEQPHKFGCPCRNEVCPKYHHNMVRKGIHPDINF